MEKKMSSAEVDYTNFLRQTQGNLYNILNSRSNVVDPKRSSSSRNFVYKHRPRKASISSDGYPYVWIKGGSKEETWKSHDGKKKGFIVTFPIIIHSTDDDLNRNDTGSLDNDQIAEDIENTLDSRKAMTELENYGYYDIDIMVGDLNEAEEMSKVVYERIITVTMKLTLEIR